LTGAQAKIYGETERKISAITPASVVTRTKEVRRECKYGLIFGKKQINFFKDSGIPDTSCVKMYEKRYLSFPGGFVLPVAWVRYTYIYYPFTGTARLYDRINDPEEKNNLISDPAYAALERRFLMHTIDFMLLSKGVRIEAHDMTPETRAGIEKKHPRFLDNFDIAYPISTRAAQQRLRDAGLDADYNEFCRTRPIKAHYGVYFFDEKK
jgi:hypothetical protein